MSPSHKDATVTGCRHRAAVPATCNIHRYGRLSRINDTYHAARYRIRGRHGAAVAAILNGQRCVGAVGGLTQDASDPIAISRQGAAKVQIGIRDVLFSVKVADHAADYTGISTPRYDDRVAVNILEVSAAITGNAAKPHAI